MIAAAQVSTDAATYTSATLAVLTAAAVFFAQRSARIAKLNRQAAEVPTLHDGKKESGVAIAHVESQLVIVLNELKESKQRQNEMSASVAGILQHQAHHEGQHEGLTRDIDRLLRRVYGNGGT